VGKERTIESFQCFFTVIGDELALRWLLLKRQQNLKRDQRFHLRDLLRYNLKTVRAYLLNEAFQQFTPYLHQLNLQVSARRAIIWEVSSLRLPGKAGRIYECPFSSGNGSSAQQIGFVHASIYSILHD